MRSDQQEANRFNRAIIVGAAIGALVTAAMMAVPERTGWMSEEGQIVESLSAALLAASALLVLFLRPLRDWLHVSVIFLLLAEREFEPTLLAVDNPVRDLAIWVDEQALKISAVQVVLGVGLLVQLVRVSMPMLWRAWRDRSPYLRLIFASGVAAAAGQAADSLAKHLVALQWETARIRIGIFEEMTELFFAVGLLYAVAMGLRDQRRARRGSEP